MELSPVSSRAAEDIASTIGKDVRDFKTVFEERQAYHIRNNHGPDGKADRSMADGNDVARIQYVLDNYDSVKDGGRTDAYWEPAGNGRNRQARTVVFTKKVNGTYYVVEAAPITKARSLYVVSAYMTKGKKNTTAPSQLPDANAPWFTAETDSALDAVVTKPTIAHMSETVKTGEADTEPPRYLQTAEEMYPAAAHPPEDAEPTDTIEAPRYLPTAEEAAKAETSNELPAPLAEEDPYLAALALDENAPAPRTRTERAAEARWAQRLEDAENAEEAPQAAPIEKRDLDELAELIEATGQLTASLSREEHLNASESLVRAETPKEHKTASEQLREAHGYFVRKMVDSGHSVTKAAKAAGDKYLYPFFNMARSSASAGANMIAGEQTDVTGKAVGKGLNDIFKPIRKRRPSDESFII